jgi:uncharacterized protein (TIGR03437 family)
MLPRFLRRTIRAAAVAVLASGLAFAATLIRGPYLQNVGSSYATIMWAASENGTGLVEYSRDRSFSSKAAARVRMFAPSQTLYAAAYYQYQADLGGLEKGAEYFYRVKVDGDDPMPDQTLRFRTAGIGPMTFLALGDSGLGGPEQLEIARRMSRESPDFLLHTGDIAYRNGTYQEFDTNHFRVYAPMMRQVPFFMCPGNHEYWTAGAVPYFALHSFPTDGVPEAERGQYYSFDWGNAHFISLDSNEALHQAAVGRGGMLEWLEKDLRETRQLWKIVFAHHPPYASTGRVDPLPVLVRDLVVPILERHGVQLMLAGHEHNYQRTRPIRNSPTAEGETTYVVTGGGGGGLYPVPPNPLLAAWESAYHYLRVEVQGDRLTLHAIRIDGQEFDSVTLRAGTKTAISSVVSAASLAPGLAPGSLVRIAGEFLAPEEKSAAGLPLPVELSGVSVTLEGKPLPLLSVSAGRINAQLPYEITGRVTLRVWPPGGFAEAGIVVSELAPSIFPNSIVTYGGLAVSESAPAEPGAWITVYLTGLGAVNGVIGVGQAAPPAPLYSTRTPVAVHIGEVVVTPYFAGLSPGFAGLYQVNFQIPQSLPDGTYSLKVVTGGVSSNAVSLPVRIRQKVEGVEP